MKQMKRKSFIKAMIKGFLKALKWLFVFLLVIILLLFFRLSIEPIHIQKLIPSIVNMAKDSDSKLEVSVSDAYLELAFSQGRLLDICLKDVTAKDDKDFSLTAQDAHVSFNPFALLVGRVIVTDIILNKPFVQVNLSSFKQVKEEKATISLERKINRLRRYFERLDFVSLEDGEINLILDENKKVIMPKVSVDLKKEDDISKVHLFGSLYFDKTFLNVDVLGAYSLKDKTAMIKAATTDFDLSKLQQILPVLENINMTINASVSVNLNLKVLKRGWKNVFEKITFSVDSEKDGTVHLPEPINTTYPIQEVLILGSFSSSLTDVVIEDSKVKLYGQTADIYATIKNLDKFISSRNFDQTTSELIASLNNLGINDVPELWPSYFGSDVHTWIKQNIPSGKIEKATLNLKMTGSNVEDLKSVLNIKDAKVVYLDTMPPLEKVDAEVVLTEKNAKIKINSALCNGVKATGGNVDFLDFDKDIPLFSTNVSLSGSLQNVLKIVSAEPLSVCDSMPISCKTMSGNATGELQLAFPFSDDLEDKLTFSVKADIEDASFPVPETEWSFENGSLKLQVNNNNLKIVGKGSLDDKTVGVDIRQSLNDDLDGAYEFKIPLSPSMIRPYFANIDEFFKGTLFTTVQVHPTKEGQTIALDFGLKNAEISLPVGYVKELDTDGTLKATLTIKDGNVVDIPSVYLSIPEESIVLKGRVNLSKNKLFELILDEIKAPRSDAKLTLGLNKDGSFNAVVSGKSLDVEDLLYGNFFNSDTSATAKLNNSNDFTLSAKLDKLFLSQTEPLTDVNITINRENGHWQDIKGSFNTTKPFTFNLDEKKTSLDLKTEDVGVFLHRIGATDRISGGILDTILTQDEEGNLQGEIKIENFSLTKTSFFMQAATLLGIVDAIMGTEYISFDKAIIPFILTAKNEINIDDAVASGTSVGITMRGKMTADSVDLDGSVVPAYAVNSLLGNVPLVGTLFSGEKGGGLFGVTYTIKGPLKNVEFDFNPASLLAPGIFRRLF